jgi:hypothetical protein
LYEFDRICLHGGGQMTNVGDIAILLQQFAKGKMMLP